MPRSIAFGWKSDKPIQRIKEALAEIKSVAKKGPVLAAEGAVLLLEKLAPAIENVDSSSGGIGSAVNRAIESLVPIIAKADVSRSVREKNRRSETRASDVVERPAWHRFSSH